jgi:hypothetical protein
VKFTITIQCEDEEELKIITSARKNSQIVGELYWNVFRNKIKHGNQEESKMYETVWEKVNEYIEERE